MKKKKIITYALSALIPLMIFIVCAAINKYIPFGKEMLNVYDSFTQYSGMLLEYKNLLKTGNIFYSWNAGLGFNFFGTITYYGASPLNLLCIFATAKNYPFFIAIMTYLRFALLGLSMCFYLDKKNTRSLYTILFSTIFALMGYTATYYYNFLWIDSIIMLPLVIHGLDKLIEENKPKFYIISLGFTILINYYIGYMICIFAFIYFIYKMINIKEKKKIIKTFIISSFLAGLIGAIAIIPSYFALKTGKSSLYAKTDYSGFNRNTLTFFYTFLTGMYQTTDQSYGPAQIYSSIMVLVLTLFYFFNTKYSKKEKIATFIVLIFYYLSFSLNALNYAWHFFQKPIWWQSRFSFTFSFFLITLAVDTLKNIDKTNFKTKYRILFIILFVILVGIGAYFKWEKIYKVEIYTYFYLFLSFILLLEMMFLIDKKYFFTMLIAFTLLDLSVNTYNSLKNNYRSKSYIHGTAIINNMTKAVKRLNEEDKNFYRMEMKDDYTSDDGLYFNYHGIRYFNSVRNTNVTELMSKLGVLVSDNCHIMLYELDPAILSLLNVKYIYGKIDYFKNIEDGLYENPNPLGLIFAANDDIKNVKLNNFDTNNNIEDIYSALSGTNPDIYQTVPVEEFELENVTYDSEKLFVNLVDENKDGFAKLSFISPKDYLFAPNDFSVSVKRNDEEINYPKYFVELKKGDKIEITYIIRRDYKDTELKATLFDIEEFENATKVLEKNIAKVKTNTNGHILEGEIDITTDNDYLFTSIEYEEGMRVYIDGKEVKPDIVLDALIGIKLSKGHHNIVIDYIPKGFIPGLCISLIGILGSIIYLQKRKKSL